jgi:hypothetical protein
VFLTNPFIIDNDDDNYIDKEEVFLDDDNNGNKDINDGDLEDVEKGLDQSGQQWERREMKKL